MRNQFKNEMIAIDGSINKWKDIVHFEKEDCGTENCSLCKRFQDTANEFCEFCPIKIIRSSGCNFTPYNTWISSQISDNWFAITKKQKIAANKMLSFLYEIRLEWINRNRNGNYFGMEV